MTEALECGILNFPRSTRPVNAVGKGPCVIGFGDGALVGFGGSVYLQWAVDDKFEDSVDYDANLILSKGRMCPLRGYTVPRSELCGALLVSRLMLTVVKALCRMEEKPVHAIMLLDSRCIISSLELTSSKLLPFFQNRLSEIQENLDAIAEKCVVEKVHWVPSNLNPADLLTRGTVNIRDIGVNSFHQKGPEFLSFSRDEWPVTREFVPVSIPEEEFRVKSFPKIAAVQASNVKIDTLRKTVEGLTHYSNSLCKVVRILARVIRGWGQKQNLDLVITNSKALTLIAAEPSPAELDRAKRFLLVHAMGDFGAKLCYFPALAS